MAALSEHGLAANERLASFIVLVAKSLFALVDRGADDRGEVVVG